MPHTLAPSISTGIAWMCDLEGHVLEAAYSAVPNDGDQNRSQLLVDVLETENGEALQCMLESVQIRGASYGWEIGILGHGAYTLHHFSGCKLDNRIIIVASPTRAGVNLVNQQVCEVWSDAIASLDEVWQQHLSQFRRESQLDYRSLDEMSRLNNELITSQRNLVQSEQRYRMLVDHAADVIARCSPQGNCLLVSPNCQRILGYSPKELQGRSFLDFIDSGCSEAKAAYESVLQCGGQVNVTCRMRCKEGRLIWVELVASSIINTPKQDLKEIYIVFRDVTDRMETQQALLERERRETTIVQRELDRVKESLIASTRLATLGKIAAQIAHDLRNPLGSVRNAAYYLKGELRYDDSEAKEFIEIIEGEVETCDTIIRNMLEATRPRDPDRKPMNLTELVQSALGRLHVPEGVDLRLRSSPNPLSIEFDPVQCRQVIDNLLSNARDAVQSEGFIEVTLESAEDAVLIRVRDSGPGVPVDSRNHIFDLLFTTKAKGTGLGLSICRQVIEQHNGTIELEEQQVGASFLIRIPMK